VALDCDESFGVGSPSIGHTSMKYSLAAALSFVALSPHFRANSRGVRFGWAMVPSPPSRAARN
jgi:hypothetical protein